MPVFRATPHRAGWRGSHGRGRAKPRGATSWRGGMKPRPGWAPGRARLAWWVADDAEGVIVELGANDALRGVDPGVPRAALDAILRRLKERGIPVLLCGMLSPPNLGADYARAFNAIYPDLVKTYDPVFYPFFLAGVVTNRQFIQGDGLHPTAAGVDAIVANVLPKVAELIGRIRAKRRP